MYRICYYSEVLHSYALIDKHRDDLEDIEHLDQHHYKDIVVSIRRVGLFFLAADYTKYALGYFQLASMAELAIVIY